MTIPIEIRKLLGVSQGDILSSVIGDSGDMAIQAARYPAVASLRERPTERTIDLSYDEMKEIAYEERLVDKYACDA